MSPEEASESFQKMPASINGIQMDCNLTLQVQNKIMSNHPQNRLAQEMSPYLLQHANNPVDWYPWGEESIQKSKKENKPIFLSIGYATCHWCHVMERESFENKEVADILNQHFIPIKVDREERPDIDKIYMTAVQAMTGQGGWPLSVWLTPDLKPFYGGTYFPPKGLYNRPGFEELLLRIHQIWEEKRSELEKSAESLTEVVRQDFSNIGTGSFDPMDAIKYAAQIFKNDYDTVHGGFGGAPKFPRVVVPNFLLQYADSFGDRDAEEMVIQTCRAMICGGIFDQIGGGFHRYSVDAQWLVPHFEKMLYDNAQLMRLFAEVYEITKDPFYADAIEQMHAYLVRDMRHPEGAFYSAEDADSEGKEGLFYVWKENELKEILTTEEFEFAKTIFQISLNGNFLDHHDPQAEEGLNVLSLIHSPKDENEKKLLQTIKQKLFERRKQRPRPLLDDKILTSWNGLLMSGYARAGKALGRKDFIQIASQIFAFVEKHLKDKNGKFFHRFRNGNRDSISLLEDYACLLQGILDLYDATLDENLFSKARECADGMMELFYDAKHGGFWQTSDTALLARLKECDDGAEPSGNSVAIFSLIRLGLSLDEEKYIQAAGKSLEYFHPILSRMPHATPYMLIALSWDMGGVLQLVIAGEEGNPKVETLLNAAKEIYHPKRIILRATKNSSVPWLKTLAEQTSEPMAYFCEGGVCKLPITNPEELKKQLQRLPS
jgi:uncharacterized protein YyaL (SSP411 family)